MKPSLLLKSSIVFGVFTLLAVDARAESVDVQICNGRKTVNVSYECSRPRRDRSSEFTRFTMSCEGRYPNGQTFRRVLDVEQSQAGSQQSNRENRRRRRSYNERMESIARQGFLSSLRSAPAASEMCQEFNQCELFFENNPALSFLGPALSNDGMIDAPVDGVNSGEEYRQLRAVFDRLDSPYAEPRDRPTSTTAANAPLNGFTTLSGYTRIQNGVELTLTRRTITSAQRYNSRNDMGLRVTESDVRRENKTLRITRNGDMVSISDSTNPGAPVAELKFENGRCYPWSGDARPSLSARARPFNMQACISNPGSCEGQNSNPYWVAYRNRPGGGEIDARGSRRRSQDRGGASRSNTGTGR